MAEKILLVRFSSIGDIVLTTPLVRALRQQRPEAEVHYLTKASFSSVVAHNPHIKHVWTIQKEVSEISQALRAEGFDYIIDLHNNLRSRELAWRLGGYWPGQKPQVYRFPKLNFQKWLLTRWKINRLPQKHIVDRYLAAVRPLGITNDGQGLDHFLGPLGQEELQRMAAQGLSDATVPIDTHIENVGTNAGARPYLTGARPYLAFVVGAAHPTKCLTEAQQLAFCKAYTQPIVLLGGPAEKALGERLSQAGQHVINTCGHFSLNASAHLLRQATLVLTHDTGLMHIAAAFRKPIVSIWGNTVADFGMYPYLPGQEQLERQRRIEVQGLSCRPCSKIGHAACPQGHFRCIRDIKVEDIIEKLKEI